MAKTPAKNGDRAIDGTFVTRCIPDICKDAGVVALCTVPTERAGPDDLGWHVADFLAFKALLSDYLHENAQTWLAHCDIAHLINDDPEAYAHGSGNDRRIFRSGKLTDNIRVQSSAEALITEFLAAITSTAKITKKFAYDLVIIICGPTTLEQDIFFGDVDYSSRIRSTQMRTAMGPDYRLRTIVATPALFSAGWQVNPSFCREAPFNPRADRTHLLAKQLGAIFADTIARKVFGWGCPMLDLNRVDRREAARTIFPGPLPSYAEKEALDIALHGALAARLMWEHSNHSFSFDKVNDDWEKLIGPRNGPHHKDHPSRTPLDLQKVWEGLERAHTPARNDPRRLFQGNLFGGVRASQLAHIKHLVRDSLTTWQGVWTNNDFGREARRVFQTFLDRPSPDDSDCHEMFNAMEHRSTLLVMADLLVGHFGLPIPLGERCRDYDATTAQPGDTGQAFGDMCRSIPWVKLPPGRPYYQNGKIQDPHHRNAHYLAASLGTAYTDRMSLEAAIRHINHLFKNIRGCQIKLLFDDPDIQAKCTTWLTRISMPICSEPRFDSSMRNSENGHSRQSTDLGTVMSALSIGDATSNRESAHGRARPEQTAPARERLEQTRISSPQVGIIADKEPEKQTPARNQARDSVSNTTSTFNGKSNGTSGEPSIQQKTMAYISGHKEGYTLEDFQDAFKCPELRHVLLDHLMMGREGQEGIAVALSNVNNLPQNNTQSNSSRMTTPTSTQPESSYVQQDREVCDAVRARTPLNGAAPAFFPSSPIPESHPVGDGPEDVARRSKQTAGERQTSTPHGWVPPHLRGLPTPQSDGKSSRLGGRQH